MVVAFWHRNMVSHFVWTSGKPILVHSDISLASDYRAKIYALSMMRAPGCQCNNIFTCECMLLSQTEME